MEKKLSSSTISENPMYSGLLKMISTLRHICVQIIIFSINLSKISRLCVLLSSSFRKSEETPAAAEVENSKLQNNNCKSEFLEIYGEYYGYPRGKKSIEELRATEFKRLNGERGISVLVK